MVLAGHAVVYVPCETWGSRTDLTSPGYLVDAIAFALLFYGCIHSLRARPHPLEGESEGELAAWVPLQQTQLGHTLPKPANCLTSCEALHEENPTLEAVLSVVLVVALLVFVFSLSLARRYGHPHQDSAH